MGEFNEKLIDYLNRFVIVVKSYNEMPMVGYNLFDLETNQISLTFLELFSTSLFVRLFSHSKIRLKKRLYFKGGGDANLNLYGSQQNVFRRHVVS